jgi:Bacterial TniB protein
MRSASGERSARPLVCRGTEEANQALMTDQQLADRFAAAELPAWENDAPFEQLLLSFESILPALAFGTPRS